MIKARTIVALLILIKYGEATESDLAKGSARIPEVKKILHGKVPDGLIQDHYGDANKPFSELWNEEGLVFIQQPVGQRVKRSQSYTLSPADHDKLFLPVKKAIRVAPQSSAIEKIQQRLPSRCNLCGAKVINDGGIPANAFSRDRLRLRLDHRKPVEKHPELADDPQNFQLLCFYCNKSKWQVCNTCADPICEKCALAFPESNTTIYPTGEDISDRMAD